MVRLPNMTVGDSVDVSCCTSFTPGGGCAGASDGIGQVKAVCGADRKYTVMGHCDSVDDIGISLSGDVGQMNSSEAGLSALYGSLVALLGDRE